MSEWTEEDKKLVISCLAAADRHISQLAQENCKLKAEIRTHWQMRGEQMTRICRVEEQNRILQDGIAAILGTYDNHDVTAAEIVKELCDLQAKAKEIGNE